MQAVNRPVLALPLLFLLVSCADNDAMREQDRLLEDPEHHIKDSPEMTNGSTILYTGWYYVTDSSKGLKRNLDKSNDTFFIDPRPIITAKNFTSLEIYEYNLAGTKESGLSMKLDQEGTESWSMATKKATGKRLAFVMDNLLLYAPRINAQITSGIAALNRGSYTKQELENFKTIIGSER